MFCPRCGASNPDAATYCMNCAAPLSIPAQPVYPPVYPTPTYPVTVSNTGTLIWGSILIFLGLFVLFHLPFAIVGVVLAAGINNRMPPDVQQQKLKSARIWCIVSTVILVLTVLLFALIFGLVLAEEF